MQNIIYFIIIYYFKIKNINFILYYIYIIFIIIIIFFFSLYN